MELTSTDFWALIAHDFVKERIAIITFKKYLISLKDKTRTVFFILFCGIK
jgi:hypothetical protein